MIEHNYAQNKTSLGAQIDVSNESSHYQNGILETPLAEESSWNTSAGKKTQNSLL